MALVIDGKGIAQRVRAEVAAQAAVLRARGVVPGLAVVLVGDDPASHTYVRNKQKACAEAGIDAFDHRLPASTTTAELLALVGRLNADPKVHGILVQLPLPKGLDPRPVLDAIAPDKDADGLHPVNVGRLWMGEAGFVPCTPAGVMRLLAESQTEVGGAEAVVIGRSNLVGRPMVALLEHANATVTVCHSRTRDLAGVVRRADIVVAAIGKAEMIRGDWIKEGATVIDVGTNRNAAGKLIGDVEFAAAAPRARAITPVPGGVGPMTIAMLLSNTVAAAQRRAAAAG
jgi:methylenetetrahydrofolate dehydrogenase (NADP+) / methenyltetrahydrofolate cyclohydrolase